MPEVVSVRRKGRSIDVAFDDGSALHCDRDFLPARRLAAGQAIEPPLLDRLRRQATRHDAERSALRWLGSRPRSRAELLRRLREKQVPEDVAREAVDGLAEQGYLDDRAFARSFIDSRLRFRPRSRAMLRAELRTHGVDGSLAQEMTREIDDLALARALVREQMARRNPPRNAEDHTAFQKCLGALLQRRGFAHAVAATAIRQAEVVADPTSDPVSPEAQGSQRVSPPAARDPFS